MFFCLTHSPFVSDTMASAHQLKGKELVRRLCWLIMQDDENFRLQLESAVRTLYIDSGCQGTFLSTFFFSISKHLSENVL